MDPQEDSPPTAAERQGRAGSIAREGDPARLADVLNAVHDLGSATTEVLVRHLRTSGGDGARLGAAAAERIRAEFVRIGWLKSEPHEWVLASAGASIAGRLASLPATEFARLLCVADEAAYDRVISRILARMWDLSPANQGAVIHHRPRLAELPLDPEALRRLLADQWGNLTTRARRKMEGLGPVSPPSEVADRVLAPLLPRLASYSPGELKKRIKERLRDEIDGMLFGAVVAPSDVELWQMRLDRAGLTLTARDLPSHARVWFPVGAFRRTAASPFRAVEGLIHDGLLFYVHEPEGLEAEAHFAEVLFRAYRDVQRREETEYVSLSAVRDGVCFRLRIAGPHFECLLQAVFPRMLRGEMRFRISLEVDITPKARSHLGNRLPVVIDQVPRYIIGMSERQP